MKIEIEEQELQRHVVESVSTGIEAGMKHWEVEKGIAEAARDAILASNIPALVNAELVSQLDKAAPRIMEEIAKDIIPVVKAAFREAFSAACVSMVYGILQGKPSYLSQQDAERWQDAKHKLGVAIGALDGAAKAEGGGDDG